MRFQRSLQSLFAVLFVEVRLFQRSVQSLVPVLFAEVRFQRSVQSLVPVLFVEVRFQRSVQKHGRTDCVGRQKRRANRQRVLF